MKIAHVVCSLPPYKGGMGSVAHHYANELATAGHRVSVFTPHTKNKLNINKHNYKLIYLRPWLRLGLGAFLPQLLYKLDNFDIVHLHYPFFGTIEVLWLKKILSPRIFKLVVHLHMDTPDLKNSFKIFSLPTSLITSSLLKKSDAITCASLDYIKHSGFSKIYFKCNEKFKEIPFEVNNRIFYSEEKKVINKVKNILFVGGLDKAHYFKGINILLEALAKINNMELPGSVDFKLNIIGDGDLKNNYQNYVKKLGLEKKVIFRGDVSADKLPIMYRRSDLFILPSINRHEAFGLVLLEAMASGVPVIATKLPGVRTVFTDGVHGLLVEPKSPHDLSNAIGKIIKNPVLGSRMGKAGRALVGEKYAMGSSVKKLNLLYEDLYNK